MSENPKKKKVKSKWENITDDQREQIRRLFSVIDTDNSGTLDFDELYSILSIKIKDKKKLQEMTEGLMNDIDQQGTKIINFDNFRDAIAEWWFVKN